MGKTPGGISAATGFQTRGLSKEFLWDEFERQIVGGCGSFEYIQSGLRSASDIYRKGGHMAMVYKDRNYSLRYDDKRSILKTDVSFLDSKPWDSVKEYGRIRCLREVTNSPVFEK